MIESYSSSSDSDESVSSSIQSLRRSSKSPRDGCTSDCGQRAKVGSATIAVGGLNGLQMATEVPKLCQNASMCTQGMWSRALKSSIQASSNTFGFPKDRLDRLERRFSIMNATRGGSEMWLTDALKSKSAVLGTAGTAQELHAELSRDPTLVALLNLNRTTTMKYPEDGHPDDSSYARGIQDRGRLSGYAQSRSRAAAGAEHASDTSLLQPPGWLDQALHQGKSNTEPLRASKGGHAVREAVERACYESASTQQQRHADAGLEAFRSARRFHRGAAFVRPADLVPGLAAKCVPWGDSPPPDVMTTSGAAKAEGEHGGGTSSHALPSSATCPGAAHQLDSKLNSNPDADMQTLGRDVRVLGLLRGGRSRGLAASEASAREVLCLPDGPPGWRTAQLLAEADERIVRQADMKQGGSLHGGDISRSRQSADGAADGAGAGAGVPVQAPARAAGTGASHGSASSLLPGIDAVQAGLRQAGISSSSAAVGHASVGAPIAGTAAKALMKARALAAAKAKAMALAKRKKF